MEIVLLDQTKVFIFSSCTGIFLGCLYDFIRFARLAVPKWRAVKAMMDIVFCLVCMVAFLGLTMLLSGGQLRWYIPGGIVLGMTLYFCGFSGYIMMVLTAVGALFYKIGNFVKKTTKREESSLKTRGGADGNA